jgi:hypothetical protein
MSAQLSPDGKYQWNGTAWIPVNGGPPAAPPKKSHKLRNIGIVVGALLLVGIGAAIANGGKTPQNAAVAISSPTAQASPTAKASPTPAGPTLTNQQQNAARSAQQYLSISGFSRLGLIDQLSSSAGDGYSVRDATIAVDSLHVNWNAEAVQSAKQYLSISGFSCKGLIQQLDSSAGDKYTVAQATYGAKQAGAC